MGKHETAIHKLLLHLNAHGVLQLSGVCLVLYNKHYIAQVLVHFSMRKLRQKHQSIKGHRRKYAMENSLKKCKNGL